MLEALTRWEVKEIDEASVERLKAELSIRDITARLLVGRGLADVDEARRFLYIESMPYHDPFLMKDMDVAVSRIRKAIEDEETILIFGDYDADGVTSTSVLVHTFRKLNANFFTYIPNRFTEGYGPNEEVLRWAKQQGVTVVITVDTGISARYEADVARELDLDYIVTDHHEVPPQLPNAYAVVNPKRPDCPYPFKELAGVGVAFKFVHALLGEVPEDLLDLVAIGTVSDLVPLVDENRKFIIEGIPRIETSRKPGIQALLESCGIKGQPLDEEQIGFMLGPRLNAAGRLDSADVALQLLISEDVDEANACAKQLTELNKERQQIVEKIANEAIEIVKERYANDRVIVVAKEGWHAGVLGIVASRLVEQFYRPVIVLSIENDSDEVTGSARSIPNFHLYENLSLCKDILIAFGGHTLAAGLTISRKNIDELRERLNAIASEKLTEQDLIPLTSIDVVCDIEEITVETLEEIAKLAPFGIGNPKPKFLLHNKELSLIKKIGSQENHVRFQLKENEHVLDGVGFQFGYLFHEVSQDATVDVVGELSINEWNGFRKPQLILSDIRVDHWQLFDYRGSKFVEKLLEWLPAENVQLIHFRKQTLERLNLQAWKHLACHPTDRDAPIHTQKPYHILLDLPESESELVDWYKMLSKHPERVYAIFYHEENHLFSPLPSREQFKMYYAILKKEKPNSLQAAFAIAQRYRLNDEAIRFMTKVFVELNFVKINEGSLFFVENPEKRNLLDSKTYQRKLSMIELEKKLLYSSYRELKNYFDNMFKRVFV